MTSKLASIALALAVGLSGLVASVPSASAASVVVTTDTYRVHPHYYHGRRHEIRRERHHVRQLRRAIRHERRHLRHERRQERRYDRHHPHVLYRVN